MADNTIIADYTLYLKNSTGHDVAVDDLGIIITNGSSITIDENDIGGYCTVNMVAALGINAASGLILSTTDIGNSSGDLSMEVAIERLKLKSQWKPFRDTFSHLPLTGNEDGDLRLVTDENVIYRWDSALSQWDKITSTFSLNVEDYAEANVGSSVTKLVFVQAEDNVYIDSSDIKSEIAYIGPPSPPGSMDGLALTLSGTSFYTGGLSGGNYNYKPANQWGTNVSYIVNDGTFKLTTPNTSTSCNYGEKGMLKFYMNGVLAGDFDLASNFNVANKVGSQSMSEYNVKGNATNTPVGGVSDLIGSYSGLGNLKIESVGMYSNFKFFQKFIASINITDATCLRQGWNSMYLVHDLGSGNLQTSQTIDFFYDIDTRDGGANPSLVSPPVVVEDIPVFRYLSGVKFYDSNSTFKVSFSLARPFANVYHSSKAPVVLSGWPGMTSTAIPWDDASVSPKFATTAPNYCPGIVDSMAVNNWSLTQAPGVISLNSTLTATPRDPYATYTGSTSLSQNMLVHSYGQQSTNLIEHFRDEVYRLPNGTYNTLLGSITGLWDSTQHIGTWNTDNTGLQVYNDALYFPTINFSVGYKPVGNPDYSILAALTNRTYFRAFKHNTSVQSYASGTIRLTGLTKANLVNGDVKVYMKLPTQTGWLDLGKDYSFSSFTGVDGDGIWKYRDSQTTSDFQFTFGGKYTQNSGGLVVVKIVYPGASAPQVSYMSIIDWTP